MTSTSEKRIDFFVSVRLPYSSQFKPKNDFYLLSMIISLIPNHFSHLIMTNSILCVGGVIKCKKLTSNSAECKEK